MTLDKHIRHALPESWSWKALGDICAITDRDHRTPVYVERGIPLISPRDFTENGIDLTNLKQVEVGEHTAFVKKCKPEKWDILYSRIGTIGEARLLDFDFDFVALHSIALVKPTAEDLSSKFVLYLLQTPEVRAQAKHNIKSVGTPDLGLQRIRNFGVPVPPPKEQRRIVAEIEKQFTRLEAGVAALRRVQANLKRYRAAVLKAACEGRLVKGDTSKWKSERLGQLVTIRYGKMLATKELSETGFPVFGANGIIGCHTKYLYEDEQVLISCRGAYSGKINLSPPQCFITNNSLVLELPEKPQVTKRFLFYALQAVDKSKMVTGSAQPQVTINNAEVAEVPLPPLAEQTRIVAEVERRLSVVEELESVVTANLQRATRLRQSILQKAFTGELVSDAPPPNKQKAA